MNKGIIRIIFMFLLVAGLGSTHSQAQSIGSVKWELRELNGRQLGNSRAYIEFDTASRRLSGDASCNRFFGNYTLSRGAFKATGVGSTRRACTDTESMRVENAFLRVLERATSLTRNGNNLVLFRGATRLARFRTDAAGGNADAGLGSKKWLLTRIGTTSVDLSRGPAFLNFDTRKKNAGGNSGCNSFGGDYTLAGSTIRFGQMISTMMACEFEGRMEIERGFMEGLRNANRYELSGNSLRIYRGSRLLLEFEGTAK